MMPAAINCLLTDAKLNADDVVNGAPVRASDTPKAFL